MTTITEAQNVPTVPEGGNTNPPPKSKKFVENPAKMWCFTVFDYTEEKIKELVFQCSKHKIKYVFGREICPETERPHLQCCVKFPEKKRWSFYFSKLLPSCTHRNCCKGTWNENVLYCTKDNNYVSNVKLFPTFIKKKVELNEWQTWAVQRILKCATNDREVLWIYSYTGGIGKSVLVDYLVNEYGALAISGNKRHVLSTAFKNPECPLYIFDIPRTNKGAVSYDAIESLRNGLFYSGFGTEATGMIRLDFNPVIVVLCNEEPEVERLSEDRWSIYEIINGEPVDMTRQLLFG